MVMIEDITYAKFTSIYNLPTRLIAQAN